MAVSAAAETRTNRPLPALAVVAFVLLTATACSSAPSASPTRAGLPSTTPAPALTGQPAAADGLCGVFTEDLAVAALGQAVDEPSGGDVLPRPNGIYCHYAAADDANVTVEAQLKDMTRVEFDALSETLSVTTPLAGVGEAAYQLDRSIMGVPGATVLAWSGGRGVSVSINNAGDQPQLLAAAIAIATKVLAEA